MKDGFFPALGTPIDEFGNLNISSMRKQVDDQIQAGASGLLVMGSMGCEPAMKQSEYAKIAKTVVDTANGRTPVLVGVMDNSIANVTDRINMLKDLKLEGVVATTPFYFGCTQQDLKRFFGKIAQNSPYHVYIYDLPGVTKNVINVETIEDIISDKKFAGIKTGNIFTARALKRSQKCDDNFNIVYSGLDAFDVAYCYGIRKNLDGMFSCTPYTANTMYTSLKNGDTKKAAECLDDILALRNLFITIGVMRGYTYSMNLLGYEGIFASDYEYAYNKADFEKVKDFMETHGMLK
jgi:4-hydroxy-tetrahydrodipicolinate synthase